MLYAINLPTSSPTSEYEHIDVPFESSSHREIQAELDIVTDIPLILYNDKTDRYLAGRNKFRQTTNNTFIEYFNFRALSEGERALLKWADLSKLQTRNIVRLLKLSSLPQYLFSNPDAKYVLVSRESPYFFPDPGYKYVTHAYEVANLLDILTGTKFTVANVENKGEQRKWIATIF
jgi:hypothetical protein